MSLAQNAKLWKLNFLIIENKNSYIDEIKHLLREKEPDLEKMVEIALKQEKMKNEQKSLKVLQLLTNKDKLIETLKVKLQSYAQSSDSFQNEIQQFEAYKQNCLNEIEKKNNMFRLNNGKDAESIFDFKQEIDRLTNQLNEKLEEINNYCIVVNNLDEKNQELLLHLEQTQQCLVERESQINECKEIIQGLEDKNEEQKLQVNQLVEKITSLASDNMKNCTERSKGIDKEESFISQIKQLTSEIESLKELQNEADKECNSVKEIHLSFLETCNNIINPDLAIGNDYDIEFVQNGIINNIKDLKNSIYSYQSRHNEDQNSLTQMENEIYKMQSMLAGKKYSSASIQTEMKNNDLQFVNDQISELQNELDRAVSENKQLQRYSKEYEEELNSITIEKEHITNEYQKLLNTFESTTRRNVKSTTSLAYSVDEEGDQNDQKRREDSNPVKVFYQNAADAESSPTFCGYNKENIAVNSSRNYELGSQQRSQRSFKSNPKKIKLSQIKYSQSEAECQEPSGIEDRLNEQEILMVEQRREIENLRKQNLSLENKLNSETKDRTHTINQLERQIESLHQMNNRLKLEKNFKGESKESIEHYIEKLEINEVTMKGALQDALKEKEYLQNYNDDLLKQVNEMSEIILSLKNQIEFEELNINEERSVNILSDKVSKQKKEIRELKGNLEKLKDKYENLILQLNNRNNDRTLIENELIQSQLSCSLGLSKPAPKALTQIESLVHKAQHFLPANCESSLGNSLLNSIHNDFQNKDILFDSCRGLRPSDLENSAKRQESKDDNYLITTHNDLPSEGLVKWMQAQIRHQEKLIQHLALEIKNQLNQNSEMNSQLLEVKEDYASKVNSLNSQFSDEKEKLIQEKKEYETKYNIAKLDLKLQFKEEKIKQLQQRINDIRYECDLEISKHKTQLKELKCQLSEFKHKFELQQDELDRNNSIILEKQTQIEVLTEAIQMIQNQSSDDLTAKFLEQNSELCCLKSINSKLEAEIQTCFNNLSKVNEELNEKYSENEILIEKLEENESAYETLRKEVETLTTDFENIESEKTKALNEVANLTKKKQDIEYKLSKKEDEMKLMKTQINLAKKSFNEKLIEIKKKFGGKLVEFGSSIYPNIANKDKKTLNSSFMQSKGQGATEGQFQGSILRISQLVSTKPDTKEDLSILGNLEQVENINDLISLHSKYVEHITELTTENRILKMQVIESDTKLNQEALICNLIQKIESLNQHLQYYKSCINENQHGVEFVVAEIDQNKEIENCKLIRELASKTKKISLLDKRVTKLESLSKTSKIYSFKDKIEFDEKIEQEVQLKFESLDKYMKEQLSFLVTDCQDSNKLIERLQALILSLKKHEIVISNKLATVTISKEKLYTNNCEMKGAIQELEKEIIKLSSKEELDKKLDAYTKEIESLKFRISKHDSERNELLQKLNSEISKSKELEQKVYNLENSIEDDDDEEKPIVSLRQESMSINRLKFSALSNNPDKTFNMNDLMKEDNKDEEIIALQNKIIVFNQQHLCEIKELEFTKSKEFSKLINEKENCIKEYISRIEYLENEYNQLSNSHQDLQNRLEQTERILNDIENELIANPIKVANQEIVMPTESVKQKKAKKISTKGNNSKLADSSLNNQESKDISIRSDFRLKPTEFVIYPSKIISLLVESKRTEASAIVELKRMQRTVAKSSTLLAEKEQCIRQLEDEIQYSRREYSTKEFNTFGNSKIKSEMNVIDEGEETAQCSASVELCLQHERRIKELEYMVEELRIKETERINELIQSNKYKSREIRDENELLQSPSLCKAMLDSIAVLCYELCEMEIKDNSKRNNLTNFNGETSMAITQTNRSLNQTQNNQSLDTISSIEICQRLVIKYLNKSLCRILMNNEGISLNLDNNFVPNNEGDRAVWYIELLESQIDITERTLKALKQFTETISVQVSGSVSSAAQVKATSIELASNTKSTAEEVLQIKHIVKLIKSDLESLKHSINQEGHNFGYQCETLARGNEMSIDASQNASNIFELNESDKIRHKLKETQRERDALQKQISNIKSLFNEKVQNDSLREMIEQIYLRSQQFEVANSEINYKLEKAKEEKDKFENMCINLEKQRTKLLEQNSWLEKEVENVKQNIVDKDSNSSQLDTLQQEISTYKSKCDALVRQKTDRIYELEEEIRNLLRDKELLSSEIVKIQNSKDIQIQELEAIAKIKDSFGFSSSALSDVKQIKKNKLKANINDSAKLKGRKQRDKEIKYHSDTEDVTDFPSKRFTKEPKKAKISDLKSKISFLEQEASSKDKIIKELALENDQIKQQFESNYQSYKSSKFEFDKNLESLENELRQTKLKYERLLLDQDLNEKSESEQLIKIKDEHAKLRVENDWLIKEVQKIKNNGFDGQSSVMQMLEDIESTKKELESQYQKEIDELQKQRSDDRVKYEEKINVLLQNINDFEVRNKELLSHIEELKIKINKFDSEFENKDNLIQKKTEEIHVLKITIKENEQEHIKNIQDLQTEIDNIKESSKNVINLYEYQNQFFKERVTKEIEYLQSMNQNADLKQDCDSYSNLLSDLAKRDAVCTNLREENKELKLEISKLKSKPKETKVLQISEIIRKQKPPKDIKSLNYKKSIKVDSKNEDKESLKVVEEGENQEVYYSIKDCQKILKQIAIKEAENIKFSNEIHILNKKLLSESEHKEELLEELEILRSKSDSEKAKKASSKKEISSLTKQHKTEIAKLQEEISTLQNTWISPENLQRIEKREKELESQIKSLKEDIFRKKELINSLKQTQEKAEKEVTEITTKIENRKDDSDKIAKLMKEVSRKDGIIKDLKSLVDELKIKEIKANEEINSLSAKCKSFKNEVNRKESMVKEARDKLEEELKKIKEAEDKASEFAKLKENVKKYKQECERKEMKISSLESKLSTNTSELEKFKTESMKESVSTKSEIMKESRKYETSVKKLKTYENISQTAMIVIRRIIKEMIITAEKLRSEIIISQTDISVKKNDQTKSNDLTNIQTPAKALNYKSKEEKKSSNNDFEFYKDSMDILGVSLNELEEFVHPTQSPLFDYGKDPSSVFESKNTLGPGLKVEDLGIPTKDNKDLEVFNKVLDAIVSDPEKLLTECEDIIQIFKKLLKEVSILEQAFKKTNTRN